MTLEFKCVYLHPYQQDISYSHTAQYLRTRPFSDVTENAALVLHLQLNPQEAGSLTFYVPVILMDLDEEREGIAD